MKRLKLKLIITITTIVMFNNVSALGGRTQANQFCIHAYSENVQNKSKDQLMAEGAEIYALTSNGVCPVPFHYDDATVEQLGLTLKYHKPDDPKCRILNPVDV